jgi:hypothetical protein
MKPRIRKTIAAIVMLASLAIAVWTGFYCWLLRDGLGPDAVPSLGMVAIHRFFEGYFSVLGLFVLALIASTYVFYTAKEKS